MVVAQQEIEQAKALAREGNSQAAISLLSKLIQVEAGNADAWLALAQVVEEPDRIEFCLQKVLNLDAGNPTALDMLSETKGGALLVGSVSGLSSGGDKPEEESTGPASAAAYEAQPGTRAGAAHGARQEIEPDSDQGVPDAHEQDKAILAPDPALSANEAGAATPVAEPEIAERAAQSEVLPEFNDRAAPSEAAPEIGESASLEVVPEDADRAAELEAAPNTDDRAAQPEAALKTEDELAPGTKPRFSFGRTDLILIGLTVLAGLVLCSLVGAEIVRNLFSF